jgi:hypothetical protein
MCVYVRCYLPAHTALAATSTSTRYTLLTLLTMLLTMLLTLLCVCVLSAGTYTWGGDIDINAV